MFWILLLPLWLGCQKPSDRKRKIKFVLPRRTKSALNRPPLYCRAGTFLILLESALLLWKYHEESCSLSSNILSLDHLILVIQKGWRKAPDIIMWKMDIIDSDGPLFPHAKSLKFKFNLELHHVWFLLVTRRLETWPQLQKKQTAFFTLRLPYRFKRKLFFFLSSMLQVWSMVNLEIKFQIRLSNGILMDCWPISCGVAACKSGWNTINFLGSILKSSSR